MPRSARRPLVARSFARAPEPLPVPLPEPAKPELSADDVVRAFEGGLWSETFQGKLALLSVRMNDLLSPLAAFGRAVGKVIGSGSGEEPWHYVLRGFAGNIGLDLPAARDFVDRGETPEGKMARLRALVAAYDLGGLPGCIGLVFSDAAQEEAA